MFGAGVPLVQGQQSQSVTKETHFLGMVEIGVPDKALDKYTAV